jgi:hypothetical protein
VLERDWLLAPNRVQVERSFCQSHVALHNICTDFTITKIRKKTLENRKKIIIGRKAHESCEDHKICMLLKSPSTMAE